MNKKLIIPLLSFLLVIAGFTTLLLCKEYNWLFSCSIATMFTMSGNLIGLFVSKRIYVAKPTLKRLGGWLFPAILCSILCRILITDIAIRNISIVAINIALALSTVFYIMHSVKHKSDDIKVKESRLL